MLIYSLTFSLLHWLSMLIAAILLWKYVFEPLFEFDFLILCVAFDKLLNCLCVYVCQPLFHSYTSYLFYVFKSYAPFFKCVLANICVFHIFHVNVYVCVREWEARGLLSYFFSHPLYWMWMLYAYSNSFFLLLSLCHSLFIFLIAFQLLMFVLEPIFMSSFSMYLCLFVL